MSNIMTKIQNMISAVKEDSEELEFLEDEISKSAAYVEAVVNHTVTNMVASQSGHTNNFKLVQADKTRRFAHNCWIDACVALNRMCERHNLEPFYEGGFEDRNEIGDFAITVTREIFDNRDRHLTNEQYVDKITEKELEYDGIIDFEYTDKHKILEDLER